MLAVASRLRADGLRVEVYADAAQMKKQLGYANAIGVSHVGILGPEEVAAGSVALKDLDSGAQQACEVGEVSARVRG